MLSTISQYPITKQFFALIFAMIWNASENIVFANDKIEAASTNFNKQRTERTKNQPNKIKNGNMNLVKSDKRTVIKAERGHFETSTQIHHLDCFSCKIIKKNKKIGNERAKCCRASHFTMLVIFFHFIFACSVSVCAVWMKIKLYYNASA